MEALRKQKNYPSAAERERMRKWELPAGVRRVVSGSPEASGLVKLTAQFNPKQGAVFSEVLTGMVTGGQWKPAQLVIINHPDWRSVTIARLPDPKPKQKAKRAWVLN